MPSCPRSEIIDDTEVGTYHIYSRCVRKAFLLGKGNRRRRRYERRKEWIRSLLVDMASIFSVDVIKYGLLDNHFHLLLRNRPDVVKRWTDHQVLRRAIRLFPEKFRRMGLYVEAHEDLPEALLQNQDLIAELRTRLSSLSWFMKVVKERIAKRSNREDKASGTFWDGRFKSTKLLGDGPVFACAIYIDLNVIYAGISNKPEESRYTSAYDRIRGMRARMKERNKKRGRDCDGFLVPLDRAGDYRREDLVKEGRRATNDGVFELPLLVYLKILDQLGRIVRAGKRGSIPQDLMPIVERLGINPEMVLECVESFKQPGRKVVGSIVRLRAEAERMGRRWLHGVSKARRFFAESTKSQG